MKSPLRMLGPLLLVLLIHAIGLHVATAATAATTASPTPVTPDASPEARALLQLLYDLSGLHTLTGQHNYPAIKDRNTQFAARYLGRTPAVFSTDLGHARAGDSDSYLARPDIVRECIRQHQRGALVTICWHAVPPTADEPVTFRQLPDSDPKALRSVQGRLLDEQFHDVLTPGTALHAKWEAQVDAIAVFLKQLDDARVPILWRPYHEMNGDWFWWGGRGSDTAALYRQIFDRLVRHHHLKNLVWVWSVDRVSKPGMEHESYFPGLEYVDVLGLDVYGNDFAPSYYTSLEKLAHGKPLALAEVGNPPSLEILAQQPKWTYYVTWAGMVRNTSKKAYATLFRDPRLLNLDDPAYARVTAPYRHACNLPPLAVPSPADASAGVGKETAQPPGASLPPATTSENSDRPSRFAPPAPGLVDALSGHWVINEEQSDFGRMGAAAAPAQLDVSRQGSALTIRTTRVLEFADDQVTEEKLTLDGAESHSKFMNSPRVTTARVSSAGDELVLDSTVTFAWGPPGSKMTLKDSWKLRDTGHQLVINRTATSSRGPQHTVFVFDRHPDGSN